MKDLGIELPEYQDAVWSYVKAQRYGDKLYIGDHVGQDENAVTVRGKVGEEGTPGAEVVSVTTAPVAWQSWLGRHARITPLCYCVP
jgi:hypothetical protein